MRHNLGSDSEGRCKFKGHSLPEIFIVIGIYQKQGLCSGGFPFWGKSEGGFSPSFSNLH